jgi:nicotinate-nucleotide adenylyltransferase
MHHRVAVFGGTFDPPHVGHLIVASELRAAVLSGAPGAGFDEVVLMVANDPWQKSADRDITPAALRLEMVQAAVGGHPGLVAGDLEIGRGGPSYMIDTVEELLAGSAGDCSLVLGADAAAGLDSWHRAADLADLVEIVVVQRPGHASPAPGNRWRVRPLQVPAVEVSSTDIRDRCRRGASIDFLVTDPVRSIISEHGLYGVRR